MKKIQVIIPAAGLGTRMRPLSNNLSKTLIPLNGKPILSWILDEIEKLKNVDEIIIVQKNNDIKEFIENVYFNSEIFKKIKVVNQDKNFPGPGGAILSALNFLKNKENILVWLGDTIYKDITNNLKNCKFNYNFVISSKVKRETSERWCIVEFDTNKKLVNLLNKPNNLIFKDVDELNALIGIYFFKNLKDGNNLNTNSNNEIEISNFIDYYNNEFIYFNIDNDYWYDCGELDSYYDSRNRLLSNSCREQTNLEIYENLWITKKALTWHNQLKLQEEYEWYKKCLGTYKELFIPKVFDLNDNSYKMSIESGTTLSDMLIYENIPQTSWEQILSRLVLNYNEYFLNISTNMKKYNKNNNHLYQTIFIEIFENFYIQKIKNRIEENFEFYKKIGLTKQKKQLIYNFLTIFGDSCYEINRFLISSNEEIGNLVHGDLHFGNILFDSFSGKFTFLDPRGKEFITYNDKEYSDGYYDYAKIYQDLYCKYSLILKGLYSYNKTIKFSDKYNKLFENLINFLDNYLKLNYSIDSKIIKMLAIINIISCIPFHKEDEKRCKAFLDLGVNLIEQLW